MASYNGWSNRDTWCFNLWVTSEESVYHYVLGMARRLKRDTLDLADELEDKSVSLLQEAGCTDTIDLDEVNYVEVAVAFTEN